MKAKKVLAMLMASAMIMGTSVTAFAADPGTDTIYGTSDDRGTISVSGVTYEEGITVTAYPIIQAAYANNGSFSGYTSLYDVISATPDDDGVINVTQDQLNQVLAQIKSDIAAGQEVTSYSLTDTDQNGSYVSVENALPVGSYLVVIENAEEKVYNPVVASISYVNEDGDNVLEEDDINIVADGNAWVKVSNNPDVTKTVSDDDEEDQKGNSADIGEVVTYTVEISSVPNYGGDYPVFNVEDTLSAGLTYNGDVKVTVKDSETASVDVLNSTEYTVAYSDSTNTLTVDFVVDKDGEGPNKAEYTLNGYVGDTIVITYSATVNENAVINAGGNNNDVTLNYTHDSKVDGRDDTETDKTYTYTFDIDGETTGNVITKTGEGDDEEALPGAKFILYTNEACTEVYSNPEFDKNLTDGMLVSDSNGQLYMKGLEAGQYWLKEIDAPDEYSVNTHVFPIVINTEYNPDGTLKNWTVTIDGQLVKTFTVNHEAQNGFDSVGNGTEIKNTKISSLPGTGGIGTTIFTIGGCVIMVTAAGLYFATRKKEQN